MAKSSSKASATTKKKAAGSKKKRGPSKLLKSLPESVEHIEIVQQVAGILEEMQSRVVDVKTEASKELKKLIKLYEGNYKSLEKKVHLVTSEAKKQAQTSMIHLLQKWHEHKEKLPAPLAKEIEKIIEQIGTKAAARKKPVVKATPPVSTPEKTPVKSKKAKTVAATGVKKARINAKARKTPSTEKRD